jgi:nucleoid DNA-binding protein
MPRKEASEAVEIFLESVLEALQAGQKVSLVGFGTFYVKEKEPRQGRNPRTGARIHIPRKRVATFKPGKAFREMVNEQEPAPPRPVESPPAELF